MGCGSSSDAMAGGDGDDVRMCYNKKTGQYEPRDPDAERP